MDSVQVLQRVPACGEDLEYDPLFLTLQQAALGKAEQQFGDTIIPAEAADWREVERLAFALLERTCDARILAYLTRAWTELRGVPGYAAGVSVIADALDGDWDALHPRLDIDGETDPLPRMNALASLCAVQETASSLRSARLLDGMHGQLSLREAEAVSEGAREADQIYPGGRERLVEKLRQAWLQQSAELLAVDDARESLRRIQACVATRLGHEWVPDFAGVLRSLDVVAQAWAGAAQPQSAAPAASTDASGASAPGASHAPAQLADAGAARGARHDWRDASIETREEAMLMLAKVSAYFEAHEPSHPAPFLIRRTQQLISLNFHDILKNLAPQGLEQFESWLPRDGAAGQP